MKRILFCVFMMSCILLLNRPAMADHWILGGNTSIYLAGDPNPEGTFHVSMEQNQYDNSQWSVIVNWVSNGTLTPAVVDTITAQMYNGTPSTTNPLYNYISSFTGGVNSQSWGTASTSPYTISALSTSPSAPYVNNSGDPSMVFVGTITTTQNLIGSDYVSIALSNSGGGQFSGTLSALGINAPESPSIYLLILGCIPLGLVLRSHKKGVKRRMPISTA